jgi:hypothetical protein
MEHDDFVQLGTHNGRGNGEPFGLLSSERRQHLYIIGQTGTGKSTLLSNLIIQDIREGRGVALLDPHGDEALKALDAVPPERADDVIYFDPLDSSPVALNLFKSSGKSWPLATAGIVSAFRHIWGDSWGPRLEYILSATLAALLQCNNTSLLGVSRMLHDAGYRRWVLRQVKDPMVVSFWMNEFPMFGTNSRQEAVGPIQNKVGQIFLTPVLRNVLGQVASKVDFRFIMDNRRIFIANLNKGRLGELPAKLMGALLVTGFELAALSRADMPPDRRTDFFLYADEFQNFATDSFANILSESRKYGLCLTLAHQYLGQLSESLEKAIFGNVGSLVSFRVSERDGAVLERQFGNRYTASQFTGLANYEICARIREADAFMGKSLAPIEIQKGRREKIIRRSREKYGARTEVIEERISRWLRGIKR